MYRNLRTIAMASAVVIMAVIVAMVAFVPSSSRCDFTSETPIWSPDGKWVVTATTRACPAGPLSVTDYDVFVTLDARKAAGSTFAGPVQIFESGGTAEPPIISWNNTNDLRLRLAEEGTVKTSKHEVDDVRIRYVVPKWIWDRLGTIQTDHLQKDRNAEELFAAGKLSRDDMRITQQIDHSVAEERTKFRKWVLDSATVEDDAVTSAPAQQVISVDKSRSHSSGQRSLRLPE